MTDRENQDASPPVGLGMAVLLAGAMLVGAAFNSANPLGVRAAQPPTSAAAASTNAVKSTYENETAGFSLETEGASVAAVVATPPSLVRHFPILTWPETKKLVNAGQIVLVDAREAVYYQTGHLPGAISLPANSAPGDLQAFASKYPKNSAIVVYCGSAQCPLTDQLAVKLADQFGYTNVREMPGGFVEYRQWEAQPAKGGVP